MAEFDTIIRGGTIVDGTRIPRYVGDLAIKNGRIAQIGGLRRSRATKELDASRLVVAPGFVDIHTHYDSQIQWDPYCSVSGENGNTTVVIGNCGFGFAPCPPKQDARDRLMLSLSRNEAVPLEAMQRGMLWNWVTFPEFLNTIDRIPKGVNVISLVGLAPIYAWVMGYDEAKTRRPTDSELKQMFRMVHEGLDAGALGWSAQVMGPASSQADYDGTPMITDLMTNDELLAFARLSAERDEGYIPLAYRDAGEGALAHDAAWPFFEKLARTAARPVHYQAVRVFDRDFEEKLRWLESANQRGARIVAQGITSHRPLQVDFRYFALWDPWPTWKEVTLGTPAERKAKMLDRNLRAVLRTEYDAGRAPMFSSWTVQKVGRSDFEQYVGSTVQEMAKGRGRHVVDALFDLVAEDDLQTEFLPPVDRGRQDPTVHAKIMESPYVMAGLSDGGAHLKAGGVSGNYGTEMLAWLVREKDAISLEQAHYKLSAMPAFFTCIRDRGVLREGMAADILVYDLDKLEVGPIERVYDLPGGDWRIATRPKGYRWILVNGDITLEEGKPTGVLPGKLLRHGAAA